MFACVRDEAFVTRFAARPTSSIMAALWTLDAFEMSRFACRIPFVPRHGTRNVVGQVCECTCVVNVVV